MLCLVLLLFHRVTPVSLMYYFRRICEYSFLIIKENSYAKCAIIENFSSYVNNKMMCDPPSPPLLTLAMS